MKKSYDVVLNILGLVIVLIPLFICSFCLQIIWNWFTPLFELRKLGYWEILGCVIGLYFVSVVLFRQFGKQNNKRP